MTLEVCTDSLEGVKLAKRYGAKRAELCSALSVGGLTPSLGLIEACSQIRGIEIHAMLRPREGDYVYSDAEVSIMLADIAHLAQAGVSGVVFGCLTSENDVDIPSMKLLVDTARANNLEATFHRAFDIIREPLLALSVMIELGVDRVLTSGQQTIAINGIDLLKGMVVYAKKEIQIMAGSGVNASNALALSEIGIEALHFSCHRKTKSHQNFEFGYNSELNEEKIASISRLFK